MEALEYYRRVAESAALDIHLYEPASSITQQPEGFQVITSKDTYLSRNLILATGFYDRPVLLGVPGEDLPKVTHYYSEPHPYYRQQVAVVGANNSAVDAALETWRKGAQVTMIIRGEDVGERVKYWARPDIVNRIKEGSIRAFFQSTITAIRPHEIDIDSPQGPLTLPNDYVIAATGYQPNFTLLEQLGVAFSTDGRRRPAYDPLTQESNVPGLYLAGVVCGGLDTHVWFIENSRIHASGIIADVLSKSALKA
jgi:thioredoxin reductase (NADPH)